MSIRVDSITPQCKEGVIRLAQISDPHLFADPEKIFLGINPWQSLQAVLELVEQQTGLDALLVTGDLSQDHSVDAYTRFVEAVTRTKIPTFALPGNHDAPDKMALALETSDVIYGRRLMLGEWQVLMLDSTVWGLPSGHLGIEELRWLHDVLQSAESMPTVVALHHHPKPTGCAWLDQHALDNGTEFLELLSRHPQVKAVLWGHVHQEMDFFHNHFRMLSVPSTCIQFLPRSAGFALDASQPGFRTLTLYPDGRMDTQIQRLPGRQFVPDANATGY